VLKKIVDHLCPVSWARVIPSIKPLSWPTLAEFGKLHIPRVLVRPVEISALIGYVYNIKISYFYQHRIPFCLSWSVSPKKQYFVLGTVNLLSVSCCRWHTDNNTITEEKSEYLMCHMAGSCLCKYYIWKQTIINIKFSYVFF